MNQPLCVPLPDRGVLRIAGDDCRPFLQGLISNNIHHVTAERALWAAFLTPQGKYLHDFFVCQQEEALWLEGEGARLADLHRRLGFYRLRSRVTIDDEGDRLAVWAICGAQAANVFGLSANTPGAAMSCAGGSVFIDPRLPAMGVRAILPAASAADTLAERGCRLGRPEDYHRQRLALGVPDGSRDLLIDKSLLLEAGFDELHGIDWDKGCYLGQELTARTRYRGLVKRRLVPVEIRGPLPPAGTVVLQDGKEVGEIRSGIDGLALALLRLDALHPEAATEPLLAGDAQLQPRKPDWATF